MMTDHLVDANKKVALSVDDVIKMAREAGMLVVDDRLIATTGPLMAFAAAIAKHEREECAKTCEGWIGPSYEFDLGRQHCAKKIRERSDAWLQQIDDENLLKMAAKAAGIEIVGWYKGSPMTPLPHPFINNTQDWNPLKYDKDALDLATRMDLTVKFVDRGEGLPESFRRGIVLYAAKAAGGHD
jgi:hypothetical protein